MSPLAASPLNTLDDIDERLIALLSSAQINSEEINTLLAKRELCLESIKNMKLTLDEQRWTLAIKRTEYIYALIKNQRELAFQTTQSLVKGRKVVQTYKKFE